MANKRVQASLDPSEQLPTKKSKESSDSTDSTDTLRSARRFQGLIPFSFGAEFEFLFVFQSAAIEAKNKEWIEADFRRHPDDSSTHDAQASLNEGFLSYVAQNLRSHGLRARVLPAPKSETDYSFWQIMYEHYSNYDDTIGKTGPDFGAWLQERGARGEHYEWDKLGMELVSRILQMPLLGRGGAAHPSLAEIKKYLEAIPVTPGGSWFGYADPYNASVHVHIGVDPKQNSYAEIPLGVLQHVALISIVYEDIITCLHHSQRRGYLETKSAFQAQSNRFGIEEQRHVCGQLDRLALTEVQDKIFSPNMTHSHLATLMGDNGLAPNNSTDRAKFVNWTNIEKRDPLNRPQQTIEWRQHHGTLDPEDISQWIRFLAALMRLAENRASRHNPPPVHDEPKCPRVEISFPVEGNKDKHKLRYNMQSTKLEALFNLLELSRA